MGWARRCRSLTDPEPGLEKRTGLGLGHGAADHLGEPPRGENPRALRSVGTVSGEPSVNGATITECGAATPGTQPDLLASQGHQLRRLALPWPRSVVARPATIGACGFRRAPRRRPPEFGAVSAAQSAGAHHQGRGHCRIAGCPIESPGFDGSASASATASMAKFVRLSAMTRPSTVWGCSMTSISPRGVLTRCLRASPPP